MKNKGQRNLLCMALCAFLIITKILFGFEGAIASLGYIDNTFGYPMAGDPQYISDEQFFGVWDGEKGQWRQMWDEKEKRYYAGSYFSYEDNPKLSAVEAAAKLGDYETAKDELQKYYIQLERERQIGKSHLNGKAELLTADLLLENFTYNARSGLSLQDIMIVDKSGKYIQTDITDLVAKSIGSAPQITFMILATNKDGGVAQFNSKENPQNKPYIKVQTAGGPVTIYPSDDSYISMGENSQANYASSLYLLAEESAVNEPQPVNGNTKRIYLKFDISQLGGAGGISSATFNIYGKNIGANEEKKVVLFSSFDNAWKESTITAANATSQVIFSYDQETSWRWEQPSGAGYRYEEELFRFDTWYDKLVKAYNSTSDGKYAYTALRILMDYINVRGNTPEFKKTLDVGVRAQYLPRLNLELVESSHMTPEVFTAFLKFIWSQANALKKFESQGNWGMTETHGLYTIAANFQEFKDAPAWVERVKERYDSLSQAMLKSDNSSFELPLGYTAYALSSLTGGRKIAEMFGLENMPYNEATLWRIRHLARYLMNTSGPGYVDNQWGNGNSHKENYRSIMRYIGEWLGDEELVFAGTAGVQGKKPDYTSFLYPDAKIAVMRSGWGDKDMYLHINADGGVGNHAHKDDLSIIAFAHGRYFLVDPLYGNYNWGEEQQWLSSSIAHNTVTINNKNQTSGEKEGSFNCWETNDSYDYIIAEDANLQDANHKREVLFVRPNFWIVNDFLTPKNDDVNTYVQAWHTLPEANITMDEATKAVKTGFDSVNMQIIPLNNASYNRSELVEGLYSSSAGSITETKYVEYEQTKSANAVFSTLLLPENVNENYNVQINKLNINLDPSEYAAYEMVLDDKISGKKTDCFFYLLKDGQARSKRQIGRFETDGRMVFAQASSGGSMQKIIVQNASIVKRVSDDLILFKSLGETAEIAIEWQQDTLLINSSQISQGALKNITILDNHGDARYLYGKINSVVFNGNPVEFKEKHGYIYFGENPIIEGGQSADPQEPKLLIDNEFDSSWKETMKGWQFANLSGAILKRTVSNGKLALVKNSDAGSTDAETLVGWYDFKYTKEQSKDSPVSVINGKDMFRGVYLAETKVRPFATNNQFIALSLLGHLGWQEDKYNATYSTYSGVDVYIYPNRISIKASGKEYIVLTESTYGREYVFQFKTDTERGKVWVSINGVYTDEQGYDLTNYNSSYKYFLKGLRFAFKDRLLKNSRIEIDYIRLYEISNAVSEYEERIDAIQEQITIDMLTKTPNAVTADLNSLPTGNQTSAFNLVSIPMWQSSSREYMSDDGKLIKRHMCNDMVIEMKAVFYGRNGNDSQDYIRTFKSFFITIKPML